MMPRFSIQLAVSRGAFETLKATHVLSRPRWRSSSTERSWLCKLATTKIGHAIFIACLRKQLVVLPLDESIGEQQRDAALEICRANAVVSAVPSENSPQITRLRTADSAADWDENPPSLLKLTSGTTAAPRAIRFRSHQLLADCNQICDTMDISDDDLNFGVIPVSHSYGFSNLLTPLIARGVPMVVSRDRTPRAVLADLARTGATVFPGTPAFYQAFCDIGDVPPLPKLRLCISAGAPLSSAVAKKFFEKFKQPIHSFYGASECGGICYDRHGTTFEDGLAGEPMQGVQVESYRSNGVRQPDSRSQRSSERRLFSRARRS